MPKSVFVIMLLLSTHFSFAQTGEIVKLLNEHFEFEQGFYDEYETTKPVLVSPFKVQNDTLTFEHKAVYDDPNKIMFIKRAVHLKDINAFVKDKNVIFIAKKKAVKETQIIKNQKGDIIETTSHFTDLFFTELHKNPDDNYTLRKPILEAFEIAGYPISSDYWYN